MNNYIKAIFVASALLCMNAPMSAQQVTLKISNATVKQAINQLKQQTGYSFVFSSTDINTQKTVSVSATNEDLSSVVEQILKGQKGIDYKIEGKNIIITKGMSYLNYHTDKSNKFTHGETGPWVEEYRKFEAEHVNPGRMVSSLFNDKDFIRCEVNPEKLMWAFYWIAVDMQDIETKLSFYDVFTAQELFDLWQCVNYRFYIGNANPAMSDELVMANASTLVENIIECAEKAIKDNSIAADLRFGHDGNVIPLLALMQIDGFDVAVRKPEEVYKHWADFKATPMASNVQLVFFRNNKGNILVKVMHNEKEAHIPVTTDSWPYYKWSAMKEYYTNRLKRIEQHVKALD